MGGSSSIWIEARLNDDGREVSQDEEEKGFKNERKKQS